MRYYNFETSAKFSDDYKADENISSLGRCQHTWWLESRGDETRFRGIGCGHRDVCPLCGPYYQLVLSRESARQMVLVQEALDVAEDIELESYGLKLVLPFHKGVSERIDALLFTGESHIWRDEVDKLYKLVSELVKKWFPGVPFVMSPDYTGESAPTEPHYHFNVYLLPATLEIKGNSVSSSAIQHYFNEGELQLMRLSWRDAQNEAFGLELKEANFNIRYIKTEAQLYHWLRYLYRHSLSDIWRGWRGYHDDTGVLTYQYTKKDVAGRKKVTLEIDREQLSKAFFRLELIPTKFKRIRWYGSLSDGQRGKTMLAFGLEREVRDDDEDITWQYEASFSFVRFDKDGIVLESQDDERQNTGQLLKVFDDKLTYSPSSVKLGRRVVWLEPGGNYARAGPNSSNA